MNELSKRLVGHRRRRGLTQGDLAALAGVSQASISRLERSKESTLDARLLARVANALGCALTDLIPSDLMQKLLSSDDRSQFYAFCENAFCSSNKYGTNKEGTHSIWWSSGVSYPIERFEEINFCSKCGTALVKECPRCKRKLEQAGTKFCQACGAQVTKHPTPEEWKRIGELITSQQPKHEPLGEDDIPF